MHVPLTLATLAVLTCGLVLLRLRWYRLSSRVRRACVAIAIFFLVLCGLGTATGWSSTSITFNSILVWSSYLGYIFLVLLFTLLRPRWLSVTIAIVLILPILSSSLLLPLADIFDMTPTTKVDLGHQVQSVTIPFVNAPFNAGADIAVYHLPAYMPFLRHRIFSARFYDTQCHTAELAAAVQSEPQPSRIVIRCPALPLQAPDSAHILKIPLP